MNHKRGRPKNRRAGCLMCKNWKMNSAGKNSKEYERPADRKFYEALAGTPSERHLLWIEEVT